MDRSLPLVDRFSLCVLRDIGQQLVDQEPHVIVGHRVILEAAVAAARRISGSHEHAHRDGHGLFVDEPIENGRRVEADAVLIHVNASRLRRIVLLGNVKRVVPARPRKDLALVERVRGEIALGNRGVFRRRKTRQRHRDSHERAERNHVAFHRFSNYPPNRCRRAFFIWTPLGDAPSDNFPQVSQSRRQVPASSPVFRRESGFRGRVDFRRPSVELLPGPLKKMLTVFSAALCSSRGSRRTPARSAPWP